MLEVMCKLYDINQDFSSLINGVYFMVIIKKTPLRNRNFPITDPLSQMGVAFLGYDS